MTVSGSRERSLLISEKFRLNKAGRHALTVNRNKGTVSPAAEVVKPFRHDFFTSSAFTGDQHICVGIRNFVYQRPDPCHLRISTANHKTVLTAVDEFPFPGLKTFHSLLNLLPQFRRIVALDKISESADLHGFHSGFNASVARHHDDFNLVRIIRFHDFQQIDPAHSLHHHIRYNQRKKPLFKQRQRFLRRAGLRRPISKCLKEKTKRLSVIRLIIHDQYTKHPLIHTAAPSFRSPQVFCPGDSPSGMRR